MAGTKVGAGAGMSAGSGQGGTGGRGQGNSPPPEGPDAETGNNPHQLAGKKHAGEMIGSFLEKGEAPAGESRVAVAEAIKASQRVAEESLEKERIPAELREVAKKYFEKLNERVQGN